MDWVLGRVVEQSHCGASVSNNGITDLIFADDAVIIAESLEVLVIAREAPHKKAKPLQLKKLYSGLAQPTALWTNIWRCQYLCRLTKILNFKSLVIPVLLYGYETWTLNNDLKR